MITQKIQHKVKRRASSFPGYDTLLLINFGLTIIAIFNFLMKFASGLICGKVGLN